VVFKMSCFRFAPSPNGYLHAGHLYSARLNAEMAMARGGTLLLRIEDIDITRCRPHFEAAIIADLAKAGINFTGEVRRQSEHFSFYAAKIEELNARGLLYRSYETRTGRKNENYALKLDMQKALAIVSKPLFWLEKGERIEAKPELWGDVTLARKEIPTSYHVSVVLDDAMQGITHVVRGEDLYEQTHIHVLLQALFNLPTPAYHHHGLIVDAEGEKLSKSKGAARVSL
jgi:glutamyl-Q tRNA(Asp) synthetase